MSQVKKTKPFPQPAKAEPLAVKVEKAGELLSCSGMTIRRMISDGRLKAVKVGTELRIPMAEINKLLGVAA